MATGWTSKNPGDKPPAPKPPPKSGVGWTSKGPGDRGK